MFTVWEFFTDPILRAPTLGSMLMCLASALVGVIAFVQKRSLIGEVLSHATYPGIVVAAIVASLFFPMTEGVLTLAVIVGGALSAFVGLIIVERLEARRVPADCALTVVLALFLGLGILLASQMQLSGAMWYRQIQVFLYGQVATMTSAYLWVYGALTLAVVLAISALFQRIALCHFDPTYARSIGADTPAFRRLFHALLILSIVIGIRSVGIIMIAGMLIAPAVAARQWTHRLGLMFLFAGLFGTLSAYLGNYFSVQMPRWLGAPVSLATGPMIILASVAFALLSLLFGAKRGAVWRFVRAMAFQRKCASENLLKVFWKRARDHAVTKGEIPFGKYLPTLVRLGYAKREGRRYRLTLDGKRCAARIVRIHRLWEVYLDTLGLSGDHVHKSAAEMEHIITPAMEESLAEMLGNPTTDPHNQPIPERGAH